MEKYLTVEPKEFAQIVKEPDVYLLDVRHADEYEDGHIAGAANIDVTEPDFIEKAKVQLPKGKRIAVYCGSGKRSAIASDKLSDAGYTVVNLDGGMANWEAAGEPVS